MIESKLGGLSHLGRVDVSIVIGSRIARVGLERGAVCVRPGHSSKRNVGRWKTSVGSGFEVSERRGLHLGAFISCLSWPTSQPYVRAAIAVANVATTERFGGTIKELEF